MSSRMSLVKTAVLALITLKFERQCIDCKTNTNNGICQSINMQVAVNDVIIQEYNMSTL